MSKIRKWDSGEMIMAMKSNHAGSATHADHAGSATDAGSAKLATKRRTSRLLLVTACMALAIAGCTGKESGGGTKHHDSGEESNQAETPKPEQQENEYLYVYPLTGLGSKQEVKERPVMIMVENQAKARPQTGLDQADLVYEILAEGEITRFVAVYQSKSPKVVGPVRSIRPYFAEIGEGLDAYIVHAGYSPDAKKLLESRDLPDFDEIYGGGQYYWRDKSRKPPHNLYTSVANIRKGAQDRKYRQEWQGLPFKFIGADHAIGGEPVNKVTIDYLLGYNVSYEYDAAAKVFKRWMEGQPHNDKETGVQLSAANVLILESKHRVLDQKGRRDVDVFGPGKGYLLQLGKKQEITWERKDGMIRAYANGQEAGLIPGQTWVQIVPIGSPIKFE